MSPSPSPGEIILVLTNAGSSENAADIARTLVEERLAACVNIVPGIRSIYRWSSEVADEEEHLLLVKTRRALFPEVRRRIHESHTYELPEVIAIPLTDGDARYLEWVDESTRDPVSD